MNHTNTTTIYLFQYEIMFCIEDDTDPAIMVVKSLMDKYPSVDANLFIGGSCVGVNPKINNLHKAYEAASYEFILISDSGIRSKILNVYLSIILSLNKNSSSHHTTHENHATKHTHTHTHLVHAVHSEYLPQTAN